MSRLVSIIMPAYNAAAFIGESVQSVCSQSYRQWELIIVNDGSSDETGALADKFALENPRISVVHQQNAGQCAAANAGYGASRGDYIKFLDADDLLGRDTVLSQMERIAGAGDAIAFCGWERFVCAPGDWPGSRPRRDAWRDMQPLDWVLTSCRWAEPMMQCGIWLIPRAILVRAGLWNESLSLINDFEFFMRVILASERVLFCPEGRLFYRSLVGGSLSLRKDREALRSMSESLHLGIDQLLKSSSSDLAKLVCSNLLQNFIYTVYPDASDLRARAARRIQGLAKADIRPAGPLGFQVCRRLLGWRIARRIELWATGHGISLSRWRSKFSRLSSVARFDVKS